MDHTPDDHRDREHTGATPPAPDDRLDRALHAARPAAVPAPEVRARHHAQLDDAIAAAGGGVAPVGGRRRRVVAAAAALALLAGGSAIALQVAGDDDTRAQLTAGIDGEASDDADGDADAPPVSAACGDRALPFAVPVGEGFGGPVTEPAPGAPGPDVDGQLVAHWSSADTAVEVRWPAAVSESVTSDLGIGLGDIEASVADGVSAGSYTNADLSIDILQPPDGPATHGISYGDQPRHAGRYTIAVFKSAGEATRPPAGQLPSHEPVWGDGMCSTVQLTVHALDGRDDVRDEAKHLYDALVAPGGPFIPEADPLPLVVDRTETDVLEPVTGCNVPAGVDQDPIRSEAVDGGGPHPTPEAALEAYLDSREQIEEDGPFGPMTWSPVATEGYTAISLSVGRVAFKFPDHDNDVVGYYFAEADDGGWSITWVEGPSC